MKSHYEKNKLSRKKPIWGERFILLVKEVPGCLHFFFGELKKGKNLFRAGGRSGTGGNGLLSKPGLGSVLEDEF